MALTEKYPEFREMYGEGYEICRNVERVMEMFSKELYELDKNIVQCMMDEMQATIDAQKETIDKMQKEYKTAALENTIKILRNMHTPEQEIITQICDQYEMDDEEVKKYL